MDDKRYEQGQVTVHFHDAHCGWEANEPDSWCDVQGKLPEGMVYLPHQCESWVIGNPDQVKLLIADLQMALVGIEQRRGRERR